MAIPSGVLAGVRAVREAREERLARPPELAHSLLRRIVRAHDPALQVIEVVAQAHFPGLGLRRGGPSPPRLGARLEGRGRGQDLDLLRLGELLPRLGEARAGLALEGAQRGQEAGLVLAGVYRQELVDEAVRAASDRARNDLLAQ